MKLNWNDLLIEDVSQDDFASWIDEWRGVVNGRVALAFLNKFGVWFLRRPDGSVHMLDVFRGKTQRLSESYDEFVIHVNRREWQEVYLLSKLVYRLHEVGKIPGPGECYAVAPHPAIGGPNLWGDERVELDQISVTSMSVWQSICAQIVSGQVD